MCWQRRSPRLPVWGWKDPRTCLTLPFWQSVIGSIRYVICIRNPDAVFASLSRRDHMSSAKAERLWLTHVQSSLAHTSGQPRLFVFYDDIMHDWAPEVRRIAAFIGCPERADDPDVLAAVGTFLDRELCHHRMTIEDLAANQRVSFAVSGLYLALRSQTPRRTGTEEALPLTGESRSLQKTLDLLGTRALETWESHATLATECQRVVHENQAQASLIDALRVERDRLVAEVGALEERSVTLSEECQARSVREQQLQQAMASAESGRGDAVRERDGHARAHETAAQELREIHASCAWTLVTVARRAIIHLLPAGTARRRFFNTVLRRITRQARAGRLAA